jgi:hypothetical protein
LCEAALSAGCTPLILKWDDRSPLPNGRAIHCAGRGHWLWDGLGHADAARLAALIAQCRLMIGIDSGPLHLAGATDTPTLGVWTGMHPIHFYDLAENVTHLVPADHPRPAGRRSGFLRTVIATPFTVHSTICRRGSSPPWPAPRRRPPPWSLSCTN